MEDLSIAQARRLALSAQGFGPAAQVKNRDAGRAVSAGDLKKMMNRLHLLQLDSVPVIVRTQYLPAFSRLGVYRHALLDRLAYDQDHWYETWAHEASLLPVAHEPLLRWAKVRAQEGEVWRSIRAVAQQESTYVNAVLREVRGRGPLRASELRDPRPRAGNTGWGRGSLGSVALDWLFRTGQLGVRRVGNFEKVFDCIDRIVPADILNQPTPDEPQAIRELLVMSAQAHGIGTADDLIDYFRLPIRASRPRIDELVEEGRLSECRIPGWKKTAYRIPGRLPRQAVNTRALVSPFDPLVWCRERSERLFNFDYRIEIYVPQRKRRWGYYVLPFVLGDRIVARVDVKNDRRAAVLRVPAAHLEAGCDAQRVADALAKELLLLARFVGAQRVVVGRRGDLVSILRDAIKLHQ